MSITLVVYKMSPGIHLGAARGLKKIGFKSFVKIDYFNYLEKYI